MKNFLSLLFCLFCFVADAQYVYRLSDLHPAPKYSGGSHLTVFNNKLVFVAGRLDAGMHLVNGWELWSFDTTSGWVEYDMNNPGDGCSSTPHSVMTRMPVCNSKIYFSGLKGYLDDELFAWDGTSALPALQAEITPGTTGSQLGGMMEYNGKVYFEAFTASEGRELWVHDPLANTTQMVKDIYPGVYDAYPSGMTVFNNKIYFSARNDDGHELHVYDPSTNTESYTDIYTGTTFGSEPNSFIVVNGKLYFSAVTATHGRELYSVDSAGTITRLTDIRPGTAPSLYSGAAYQPAIGVLGSKLYFAVHDTATGQQLYTYDIPSATASLAKQMNDTPQTYPTVYGFTFATYHNNLYFGAEDSTHGIELWKVDGSTGVPTLVKDLRVDSASSDPHFFTIYNDLLYFVAADTVSQIYVLSDSQLVNGINDIHLGSSLDVFPNPVSSVMNADLQLTRAGTYSLQITDLTGRRLAALPATPYKAGTNKLQLPVSHLAPGMYFYKVNAVDGSTVLGGKLLKE